ncbi:MAG TPA: 3'(2'),5'-bisphosphate nucleotidase CysQ [Nevskiaceae bacterium]|nr:3'(2'),5'-bisphosphate nucleotidase CysQ [Nevskiaceae bacterium]
MDLVPLLQACNTIATEAGEAIMAVYKTDFAVQTKADDSPLTQADLASNRIITQALAQLEPKLPCLSEEGAKLSFEERSRWSQYWLIDPLDGTKEFVKRNGEFTVNIALIEDGAPILGVVHAPVLRTTYLAARHLGAWRKQDGMRERIRARHTPERPTLVVSKSHHDAALDAFLAHAPEHETVSRGSSLKFCLVAEGSADFYPRTGPTSEWDTGAGQCVAEQAHCQVLQLPDWQPLCYNQKDSLLNPGFVVIGDKHYDWQTRLTAPAEA